MSGINVSVSRDEKISRYSPGSETLINFWLQLVIEMGNVLPGKTGI